MDIQGKVALVTGAGSGIGRGSALRLAREGAAVVVADIDEPGGQETVRMISDEGGKAGFVSSDVTKVANARAMVAFAEDRYGGLDILHNNAGIITGRPRYPEAPFEAWSLVLDVNLRGVLLGTQYGIAAMRRRGGGVIVSTASLAGIYPYPPDPVYSATKAGVVFFTQSLAALKEEANIRVNCVCPGLVLTPLLEKARATVTEAEAREAAERIGAIPPLTPEDIADAVVELVQDDSIAGRAMLIPNGRPRSLAPVPTRIGLPG